MNGKSKCRILKDIRKQIAKDNDIEFITSECQYQGECSGTCPKCESELRYLEQELRKRQAAGKAIAVVGLATTLMAGTVGCDRIPSYGTAGMMAPPETESQTISPEDTQLPDMGEIPDLMGDLVPDPTTETTND